MLALVLGTSGLSRSRLLSREESSAVAHAHVSMSMSAPHSGVEEQNGGGSGMLPTLERSCSTASAGWCTARVLLWHELEAWQQWWRLAHNKLRWQLCLPATHLHQSTAMHFP